jgi:hypothetical protein
MFDGFQQISRLGIIKKKAGFSAEASQNDKLWRFIGSPSDNIFQKG